MNANSCPVCKSDRVLEIGRLPWYSTSRKEYTDVLKCANCGLFYRDIVFRDLPEIKGHFEIAPYTKAEDADKWQYMRDLYFNYLIAEVLKIKPPNKGSMVLDIGCSFGHLLEGFSKSGSECFGVEVVDSTRMLAQRRNPRFTIYESIGDIPCGLKFDIIALIDVLYYIDDPLDCLNKVKGMLKEDV